MERLRKISNRRIESVKTAFRRFLHEETDWELPLIMITGPRGAGKTTFLLQHLKNHHGLNPEALYVSLDDIYFEANRLVYFAEQFYESGGRCLYLDEVHRYAHWSKDLKILHDNLPDLQIIMTGSSILELLKGESDLSRRMSIYHLPGLSFREYLLLKSEADLPVYPLAELLQEHQAIAAKLSDQLDIIPHFGRYLQHGYFPFFMESVQQYPQRLLHTVNLSIESDIPACEGIDYGSVRNLKKLLYILSQSVPFTPNISSLSEKVGVTRGTLLRMLDLLDRAGILLLLRQSTKGISLMAKPEKIYLDNTNLAFAVNEQLPDKGQLRETFFFNQLRVKHQLSFPKYGDFLVDDKYWFEVGGAGKTAAQIQGLPNAFIAADDIKQGKGNKIPIWLFGFLY